jgi:hypothetical protein
MDYSTMTMAAFLAQVERVERATGNLAAVCCGERHALIDKPAHRLGALLDDSLHDIAVAESYARVERIADVGVNAVLVIQHRCDAALGIERCALIEFTFAEHCNASERRCSQRKSQACGAAADNK